MAELRTSYGQGFALWELLNDWHDKPDSLVYQLAAEVDRLQKAVEAEEKAGFKMSGELEHWRQVKGPALERALEPFAKLRRSAANERELDVSVFGTAENAAHLLWPLLDAAARALKKHHG